jgi:DNA-3-methyladenine glycosylase I
MIKNRCDWPGNDPLMIEYHDREWGVPVNEDHKWFEFILLDTFQAGLSWRTILYKRNNFRKAFDDFDYREIALYGEKKVADLLTDSGIIRNRLKIAATINNSKVFISVQKQFGTFNDFIWQFTDGTTIINRWNKMTDIPAVSKESDLMSRELKKLGFKFVGSTTCYAFMQAGGMVNDHLVDCFRYSEVNQPTK